MDKVGLAVVTYKDNFGSALQTYATQYIVDKLGYQSECINADGIISLIESNKRKFFLIRIFHPEEFRYIWSYAISRLKRGKNNKYASNMKIRHIMYKDFKSKYLNMSKNVGSFDELTILCDKYDTVLVGSDQLWRPSNIAGGYFTLEAIPDRVNKISYATSFGVKSLPKMIQKQANSFLLRMNHISVRENSGSEIVKSAIGKEAPVVCDPTMLLTITDWQAIQQEEPIAKGDYIVCYLMGKQKKYREFVKKLREKTGYRVIALLHGSVYIDSDELWPDEKPYDVGPSEFLNLIKYAKYVCTDSFHCCVFSILNKIPFFVFRRDTERKTTSSNDRIYTLLSWTGLNERLIHGDEEIEYCLNMKIDFDNVQNVVDEKRAESLQYLTCALKASEDKIDA